SCVFTGADSQKSGFVCYTGRQTRSGGSELIRAADQERKFMSIEDKIRNFILKNLYYAEGTDFNDDVSVLAEGVIGSMGSMELVAFVESEFKIKVEHAEVPVKNFDSVGKMAAFVRRKLGLAEEVDPVVRQQLPPEVNPPGKLEAA